MAYLNLASIRECTDSEGPGKRFALWCQGCMKRCFNCCNPQMQAMLPNKIVDSMDIIRLIEQAKQKYGIEGVSFIGGEPLLQAQGLYTIAKWCRENGLSVLVFTGYTLETIQSEEIQFTDQLLKYVDILVDGEFVEERYDTERDWVGSTNQRVILLSDFYKPGVEVQSKEKSMEIQISHDKIAINGWPFEFKKYNGSSL